jgi:hypothetical protein
VSGSTDRLTALGVQMMAWLDDANRERRQVCLAALHDLTDDHWLTS